jgi:hypothetical protein
VEPVSLEEQRQPQTTMCLPCGEEVAGGETTAFLVDVENEDQLFF